MSSKNRIIDRSAASGGGRSALWHKGDYLLRFYRKLYTSERIKHPDTLKWRLRHHAGSLDVYVITLCKDPEQGAPAEGGNQLEFYHNAFLQQPYYRQHDCWIVGLAKGRSDAVDLCVQIVEESLAATGEPNVYPYLFPEGEIKEYFAS